MKKIMFCITVSLTVCLLASALFLCLYRPIKAIRFLEVAGPCPIPETVEYKIPQEIIDSVFGQKRKIYKIVSRRTLGYDKELLEKFEMKKYRPLQSINDDIAAIYTTGNQKLSIYKDGTFSFCFIRVPPQGEFLRSSNEIIKDAERYLKSKDLLPENFYQDGCSLIKQSGNAGTKITQMEPIFRRSIDGYEVYGSSYICVTYDSEGVLSVDSMYSGYEPDRTVSTISFEEACALVKTKKASISYEAEVTETPDKVVIDTAKLIYFDTRDYNEGGTHILPCYVFEGLAYVGDETTKFQATVMAIPESMTTR